MNKLFTVLVTLCLVGCVSPRPNSTGPSPETIKPDPKPAIVPAPPQLQVVEVPKDITEAKVISYVRDIFSESDSKDIKVSVKNLSWVEDTFNHVDSILAPNSKVFAVEVRGNLTWPFPGETTDPEDSSKKIRLKGKTCVLAIQPNNGRIIAATIHPN